MEAKEFWARVKTLLKEKKITQKQLSLDIGCAERSVDIWIAKDNVPGVFEAYKIARILGVSVEYLVTGEGPVFTIDTAKLSRFIDENKDLFVKTEITGDIGFNPSISPDK